MKEIRSIGITGHYANELAKKRAKEMVEEIKVLKLEHCIDRNFSIEKNGIGLNEFKCDLILCFGGDGTLLHTARNLEKDIPIMGVNCGDVGYITQIKFDELKKELPRIVKGEYEYEERTRLCVSNIPKIPLALNEYALVPSKNGTLMSYDIYIDGIHLYKDDGDGVIIATATGSTGRALSSGGPIIYDNTKVFSIVPTNSNDRTKRPMIVSEDSEIRLSNYAEDCNCEIVVDGQRRMAVESDLIIKKTKPMLFVRLPRKKGGKN